MTGAQEYGKALFLLTEEENTTERVVSELDMTVELLRHNPEYTKLLDTPALSKDERLKLIDEAFVSFDENLKNLIKIMAESRKSSLLPSVRDAFVAEYTEARGILYAEAITAVPLTDEQQQKMAKKLEEKTQKKVVLKNLQDKSILGGVVLRYGGVQLDGSVKTRLASFEAALRDTII